MGCSGARSVTVRCSLELCEQGLARLKPDVTLVDLQERAIAQIDLAAAQEMQRAKAELFRLLNAPRG